jgi:hypothetical protein
MDTYLYPDFKAVKVDTFASSKRNPVPNPNSGTKNYIILQYW